MRLSFTSPQPDWTMYTSSPRTDSPISTHVSRLLNFLVTTFPVSMPRRSQSLWVRSGGDDPEKTLMLGILDSSPSPLLSLPPLTTAVVLTTWSREMSAAAAAATGGSISAAVAPKTSHSLAVSSEHGNQSGWRKTERERERA